MATVGSPSGAINGNGTPDPAAPSKDPEVSSNKLPEGTPLADPPQLLSVPPAVIAQNDTGSENDRSANINRLAFKRDPPVARGPYYSTQVE